jgi:hypothetical protein
MQILGAPAPGKSSGQAMAAMEELAEKLPEGIGHSWTGLSFQERQAGSQTVLLYSLSILVVFLCLAALYESWSLPASSSGHPPRRGRGPGRRQPPGLSNDVYFQVGLLTTMGLAAKNAILIVEFAKSLAESGMDLVQAVIEAARQRLRPIIMTSLAFGLGRAAPGAELRRRLGWPELHRHGRHRRHHRLDGPGLPARPGLLRHRGEAGMSRRNPRTPRRASSSPAEAKHAKNNPDTGPAPCSRLRHHGSGARTARDGPARDVDRRQG